MSSRKTKANAEKAFAAYLLSKLDVQYAEQDPLSKPMVYVRGGEIDNQGQFKLARMEEIQVPSVCVAVPNATYNNAGFWDCEMYLVVIGSVDAQNGITQPQEFHETLAGFVLELVSQESLNEVMASLNPPEDEEAEDPRPIKDFMIFGIQILDDSSTEIDRRFVDKFKLKVPCQATTDTSL